MPTVHHAAHHPALCLFSQGSVLGRTVHVVFLRAELFESYMSRAPKAERGKPVEAVEEDEIDEVLPEAQPSHSRNEVAAGSPQSSFCEAVRFVFPDSEFQVWLLCIPRCGKMPSGGLCWPI